MSSQDTNDSQPVVEKETKKVELNEEILASLQTFAPNTEVRDVIRAYDPAKTMTQIRNALNRFSKPRITSTLEYLNVDKNEWKDHLKPKCMKILMQRIQNLMPKHCTHCNASYVVDKDQESLLPCERCGVDVHKSCLLQQLKIGDDTELNSEEVKKLVNPHGLLIYLCSDCNKFLQVKNETISNMIEPVASATIEEVSSDGNVDGDEGSSKGKEDKDKKEENKNKNNPKKQTTSARKIKTKPIQEDHTEDEDEDDAKDEDSGHSFVKREEICRHYKKGKCEHGRKGENCQYSHPKPCRKLMEHGNKGPRGCQGNCKSFHPRMCFQSLKKGECFNEQCNFVHVKGTKRKKDPLKDDKETTNKGKGELKKENSCKLHEDHSKDFLDILHDFKTKILETVDKKLETMLTTLMTPKTNLQQFPMQMTMPWFGMQPMFHKN